MSDVIGLIQDGATETGAFLIDCVKTLFVNFLYDDYGETTQAISDVAKFGFIFIGFSLVLALSYWVIGLVRRKI